MANKLYCDMTRKEQREYRTKTVANWIKDGVPFAIVLLSRKCTSCDGWYWKTEWNWKDCEGDLKPIDKELLYKELGITEKETDPYLAPNLKRNGYDILDLNEVIVFNPTKYNK